MDINLKWGRKGIDSMAEKIRRDGECAELSALVCLDMIVMLQAEVKRLETENEELGQQVCSECSPENYGWIFNRVEGKAACGCMTEAEPFQILQAALERIAQGNYSESQQSRMARKALHAVLPLDHPDVF